MLMLPISLRSLTGYLLVAAAVGLVLAALLVRPSSVAAEPPQPAVVYSLGNEIVQLHQVGFTADISCRECHAETTAVMTFPSGEEKSVQVDLRALDRSVHGRIGDSPLACADCHRPASDYRFPHAPVTAADLFSYRIERATTCTHCHTAPHLTSHPGPGSDNPVTCVDCHTGHEIHSSAVWRSGDGVGACLDCHTNDTPHRLTTLIQAGMFASQRPDNGYCLACHSQPDLTMTLASGEQLSLTVDPDTFNHSVHGLDNSWQPLNCTDCHENYLYPHEPVTAVTRREYALEKYQVCAACHDQNYSHTLDSVHGLALAEGNLEAAMCTDCHSPHDMPDPNEPRSRIAYTCEQCHSQVFEEYAGSVHGAGLLNEDNPDVPACTDCHGVHTITDPTTTIARVSSPQLCAQCHADPEMMGRYDISLDVFNTYVADFHGTTVTLFEYQDDPDIQINVALCTDCHGVHAILRADDPHAGIQENLLVTCQECHPTATANFPAAWTSHHQPSLEHNRLTYLVTLFYQIFIPLVLGPLTFLVLTDVYRRFIVRR
jgi:predicted CXXCH cytochrome family protein